jgi:hypothetical protein
VPCVIRAYSDSAVLELQIIENLQREDLDPLEEAAGYQMLIASNPSRYSAAFIADRIGRSEKYVWDTLRLLNLVPEATALLEEGRITRSHAVLLAKLPAARQTAVIDPDEGGLFTSSQAALKFAVAAQDAAGGDVELGPYAGKKAVSVRELEHYIADHVRFNLQEQAAMAPLDFGETATKVEQALAQPGRGKKVIAITHEYHVHPDAKDEKERTFGPTSWKRADGLVGSHTCEHAVLGVVTAGAQEYGQSLEVCIAREKCAIHWKQEQRDKGQDGGVARERRFQEGPAAIGGDET